MFFFKLILLMGIGDWGIGDWAQYYFNTNLNFIYINYNCIKKLANKSFFLIFSLEKDIHNNLLNIK